MIFKALKLGSFAIDRNREFLVFGRLSDLPLRQILKQGKSV